MPATGDPKEEELSSDTEYFQVRSPDDYDLLDDEDNTQSSQSSFADPITPTPARKRFCERAETQPYSKRPCRSFPCSEFGSQAGTPRSLRSSCNTSRPTSSQQQSQSPGPRFSDVPRSSSARAKFAERTKNLLRMKDKFPLGKLGLAISQHDMLADYHTFVFHKMGDVRPDIEEGKSIAQRLSDVPQSSDLIVRQLMNIIADQSNMIIGLTAAVDSCMLRLGRVERELAEARSPVEKKSQESKLPEETCLAFENLTQMWHIPQLPLREWPDLSNARFNSVDLNAKMASWIRTNRGRPDDHVTACTDFFRAYLKEACEPPALVKRYAVRISRSCAKRSHLHDLPEQVVEQLIGVCLDGLRLGMWELSSSAVVLKRNPTPYWVALGETDEEREAELDKRKKARGRWRILVRGALQRALCDIRKYVLDENGRLVPAPKNNVFLTGTEPRTSRRTLDEDDDEEDTE